MHFCGARSRFAVPVAAALLLSASNAPAAEWVDRDSGLGLDEFRAVLSAGPNYGIVNGAEVERVDPSLGFSVNGAFRLMSSLSIAASVASNTGSVDGQLRQLQDVNFREDGRSATVVGEVRMFRFGVGARLDAFRTEPWRYRPYVVAQVLRSRIETTVDSVDGGAPRPGVASLSSTHWGALGRAGVDVRFTSRLGLDVFMTHEILEFPAGTAGISTAQAGVSVRI